MGLVLAEGQATLDVAPGEGQKGTRRDGMPYQIGQRMKHKRNEFPGVIPDDGGRPYCHICKALVSDFKYRPGLLVRDGSYAAVLEYQGDDVLVIRCHGSKWVMRREALGRWSVDAVSLDTRAHTLPASRILARLDRPRRIAGFLLHPGNLFHRAKRKPRP